MKSTLEMKLRILYNNILKSLKMPLHIILYTCRFYVVTNLRFSDKANIYSNIIYNFVIY